LGQNGAYRVVDHRELPMTTTLPILTVIVINWNGVRFLPRCFQSLREQTLQNFQIILADNGSMDESVALTERDFPEVNIVRLSENYGYAEANNRAAAESSAKYLLFLNNDTHLHPHALAAFVEAAEADPLTHIWAPQQWTYDGSRLLNIGMCIDILSYPCGGKDIFYSDGAAFFIRRAVFQLLGGFDSYYFMWWEDSDLCWRAWLRGYRVAPLPNVVIYHQAGGTAGSSLALAESYSTSVRKRYFAHRNQLATLLKNYSAPVLCVILPLFAALTIAEIIALTVTGQRSTLRDVYVAGWRDLLRHRSYIRAARRRIQSSRVVSDWHILRRMRWQLTTVRLFLQVGVPTVKPR